MRVAEFFVVAVRGFKTETFFVLRGDTVVFTAFLDVVDLGVWLTVVVWFFPRVAAFSVRTAASALNMQTIRPKIKYRIFFISGIILANL